MMNPSANPDPPLGCPDPSAGLVAVLCPFRLRRSLRSSRRQSGVALSFPWWCMGVACLATCESCACVRFRALRRHSLLTSASCLNIFVLVRSCPRMAVDALRCFPANCFYGSRNRLQIAV